MAVNHPSSWGFNSLPAHLNLEVIMSYDPDWLKHRSYDNLYLPLCPKCGDTKHVVKSSCLSVTPIQFCTKCRLEWGVGGRFEEYPIDYKTEYDRMNASVAKSAARTTLRG